MRPPCRIARALASRRSGQDGAGSDMIAAREREASRAEGPMAAMEHFATRDVAPERRLDYWNACARATFPGMTVDATDVPFEAELARWRLGALVLARPRSQGSVVRRAAVAWPDEHLIVHLQRRGVSRQRQRARELVLRPGDVSACTTAAPLQLSTERHELLVVQVPRASLEPRLPDLDDRLGRIAAGAAPATRLLHDFVLALWRDGEAAADDPDWEGTVAGVLLDLVALALRGAAAPPVPAEARELRRLRRLVEARLGDPELRGAALAGELGLSLRRVQQLFAAVATTPGAYILHRRLARAAELLEGDPGRSVTALAFDLGFNDSAYFSRCFRRRFGASPSAWRAGRSVASR